MSKNKKHKSQVKEVKQVKTPVTQANPEVKEVKPEVKPEIKPDVKPEIKLEKPVNNSVNKSEVKAKNSEFQTEFFKKAIRLGGTLFAVTAVTGFILGTDIAIKRAELEAKNVALRNVMPAAVNFESVETVTDDFVTDVQKGSDNSGVVGYCLSVSSKGYGGIVNFIVGITSDGTVKAINILNHSETPGLGAKATEPEFYEQFNDKKAPLNLVKGAAGADNEISAISGATITSTAVTNGVNAAFEYWQKNLKGGN